MSTKSASSFSVVKGSLIQRPVFFKWFIHWFLITNISHIDREHAHDDPYTISSNNAVPAFNTTVVGGLYSS